MCIDSGTLTTEELHFQESSALMQTYEYPFDPRDDCVFLPIDAKLGCGKEMHMSTRYGVVCHTTTNDLILQYSGGHGKLVIDDFRIKAWRMQRVFDTVAHHHEHEEPHNEVDFESPEKGSKATDESQIHTHVDKERYHGHFHDGFGKLYLYCLEKGYGEDPDTIVKYEVQRETV